MAMLHFSEAPLRCAAPWQSQSRACRGYAAGCAFSRSIEGTLWHQVPASRRAGLRRRKPFSVTKNQMPLARFFLRQLLIQEFIQKLILLRSVPRLEIAQGVRLLLSE